MELFFVYNAKIGLGNMIIDGMHKVVRPSTYGCDLCSITYHALGKRKAWKTFLKDSNVPMHFYYLDKLPPEIDKNFDYPAVLRYENSTVSCILDKQDFAAINDLNDFIVLLKEKVPELSEK
ncbi:MAG: hypothetical protein Crog4KO_33020 [Crocinitomicaceae bacterium]